MELLLNNLRRYNAALRGGVARVARARVRSSVAQVGLALTSPRYLPLTAILNLCMLHASCCMGYGHFVV